MREEQVVSSKGIKGQGLPWWGGWQGLGGKEEEEPRKVGYTVIEALDVKEMDQLIGSGLFWVTQRHTKHIPKDYWNRGIKNH